MAIRRRKISVRKYDPFETNAYLVQSRPRLILSLVAFCAMFVVFLALLNLPKINILFKGEFVIGLSILAIGGLALLIPSTEEWVYNPWQSATQKYDKNFYD